MKLSSCETYSLLAVAFVCRLRDVASQIGCILLNIPPQHPSFLSALISFQWPGRRPVAYQLGDLWSDVISDTQICTFGAALFEHFFRFLQPFGFCTILYCSISLLLIVEHFLVFTNHFLVPVLALHRFGVALF